MENIKLQTMDITSLKAVLKNLREKIVPSRFEKAQQVNSNTIQIGFRSLKAFIWIEISWNAGSPIIVEIDPPPKIKGNSTLARQVQHGLKGMTLVELNQNGFERIVEFHFAFRPNQVFQKLLVVELMGRHSNLFFLDQSKQVITLGKQIREHQSRIRPICTGDNYLPPPALRGVKPTRNDSFEIWKDRLSAIPINLGESLKQNFQGISPSLALQLAGEEQANAMKLLAQEVKDISDKDWENLYLRWSQWLKVLEEEKFSLCFNGPTSFRVWNIGPIDLQKKDEQNISIRLGKYYKEVENRIKLKTIGNSLKKDLEKFKSLEKELIAQQEFLLSKKSEVTSMQRKADSILCLKNLSKENIKEAQLLYKNAKKIKRSESYIKERIKYHNRRMSFILDAELFLEEIIVNNYESLQSKINNINELRGNLEQLLDLKIKQRVKSKKDFKLNNFSHILETKAPSGLQIQIGRNQIQNELISIKKARKGDIWFHAQECPGSHVILKASNGMPEELDFQNAADLAAFFSRAKNNVKVPIIMAQAYKLKKIKGAMPGTVTHQDGKVLWGDPLKGKSLIEKSTVNVQNGLSSLAI